MADAAKPATPSPADTAGVFAQLLQQMIDQNKPVNQVNLPDQAPVGGSTAAPASDDKAKAVAADKKSGAVTVDPQDIVTNAILNQGQLIKTNGSSGGGVSQQSISGLNNILNDINGKLDSSQAANAPKKSSGDALGSILKIGASLIGWIICTELVRQGKLPKSWWVKGARIFAAYPEAVKEGYYLWAIPSVRHLRKHPNSMYSKLLENVFYWRAENIASRRNYKGIAVTVVLWPICYFLGILVLMFKGNLNWKAVYKNG